MTKENLFNTEMNWYEIWLRQNKLFFDIADKHLNPLFNNRGIHPNLHSEQINAWLNALKMQWDQMLQKNDMQNYLNYYELFNELFATSTQLLLKEWLKCADNNQPINTVQELYHLWMKCCQHSYYQALQSEKFKTAYAELVNKTFESWKEQLF